jgi:hypothetical protein
MIKLFNILDKLKIRKKRRQLDPKKLPSMGLFYKDDYELIIKKANVFDIRYYDANYIEDPMAATGLMKLIIKNNVISNYPVESILAIDLIYIFFMIVNFTKGKPIDVMYEDGISIPFSESNFGYFNISEEMFVNYSSIDKNFLINGYKFRLPSIGIEDSITKFIAKCMRENTLDDYKSSYDFMYFLGEKNELDNEEIINIINLFNEFDYSESKIIEEIIEYFTDFNSYRLIYDGTKVQMGQLDLANIWHK